MVLHSMPVFGAHATSRTQSSWHVIVFSFFHWLALLSKHQILTKLSQPPVTIRDMGSWLTDDPKCPNGAQETELQLMPPAWIFCTDHWLLSPYLRRDT